MNCVIPNEAKAVTTASPAEARTLVPAVNIHETQDGYVLEAEMPGVSKDGVEVLIEGNGITVLGRRESTVPAGAVWLHRESRPEGFRREFMLDSSIDRTRIQARMDQGVLTVRLPKAEAVRPRKIEVNG